MTQHGAEQHSGAHTNEVANFEKDLETLGESVKQRVKRILSLKTPEDKNKYILEYTQAAKQRGFPSAARAIVNEDLNFQRLHDFFSSQELNFFGENTHGVNPFFYSHTNLPSDAEHRKEYLAEKVKVFSSILQKYRSANKEGRRKIQDMYPVQYIKDKVSSAPGHTPTLLDGSINAILADLRTGGVKEVFPASSGAENDNRFFVTAKALKTSKENRHGDDYYSILQLMVMLLQVELDFNDRITKPEEKIQVDVKTATQSFGVTRDDATGSFRRDIVQEFASGQEVDVALKQAYNAHFPEAHIALDEKTQLSSRQFHAGCKAQIPLFLAYKKFLERVQSTANKENGYLLDITDSRQGMTPARGNVLSTSNIFVEQKDAQFTFTVIDPDVFNTDGNYKFSARDKARVQASEKGVLHGVKTLAATVGLNQAREIVKWGMQRSLKQNLKKVR